jgi:hypothetical protein
MCCGGVTDVAERETGSSGGHGGGGKRTNKIATIMASTYVDQADLDFPDACTRTASSGLFTVTYIYTYLYL